MTPDWDQSSHDLRLGVAAGEICRLISTDPDDADAPEALSVAMAAIVFDRCKDIYRRLRIED